MEARIGESKVYMDEGELKIPVLWREALVQGRIQGPLLITENQTTTVVPKNSSVSITQQGVLRLLWSLSREGTAGSVSMESLISDC